MSISRLQSPKSFVIEDQIAKYVLAISIFYCTISLLEKFKKSYLYLRILFIPIPFIWYYSMKYILYYYFFPTYTSFPKVDFKWDQFILTGLWWISHFAMYGFFYWYYFKTINDKKALFDLKTRNLHLQNENIKMENNFLRAQINPHFLYNCLNFFYSETLEKHPYVADGILMLSDIMRYSLKDYSHNNGLTELSEEIEHIENVVNIHQMRFVGSLHIKIKVEGHPEGKLIAPMVLITLVENVFKHGDLHDSNHPAIIHCKIDEAKKNILLSTFNKKKTGSREPSTGIGLANIEQRLQSLYPDNFSIHTFEDDSTYKKDITIPYFEHLNELSNDTKTYKHTIC